MDERTSPICKFMNGKVFKVKTAAKVRDDIINSPPEMVKTNHPWLSFKDVQNMTDEQLQAAGFVMPPFHFHCRTTTVMKDFFSGTVEQRAAQIEDMSENEKKFFLSALAVQQNRDYNLNDKKGVDIYFADGGWPPIWPPNNGFLGTPQSIELSENEVIDRYGPESGRFFATLGTPDEKRALPGAPAQEDKHAYRIKKKLKILKGITAPWFEQPGRGIQYMTDKNVKQLIEEGYLEEISKDGKTS